MVITVLRVYLFQVKFFLCRRDNTHQWSRYVGGKMKFTSIVPIMTGAEDRLCNLSWNSDKVRLDISADRLHKQQTTHLY